jgi:hypothetical protein
MGSRKARSTSACATEPRVCRSARRHEGEDVVVDDVVDDVAVAVAVAVADADAGGQAGADERELAILTERVLHGSGEFAQVLDLVLVDLVEGDQDARAVLGQQVGEQLDLVAQTRLDDMGLSLRHPFREF